MKNERTTRAAWLSLRAWICPVFIFALSIGVYADTITVTNTNDSGPGSLRQALVDANDGDTIDFAVTGTIGLTSGELLVNKAITISGPGSNVLAINGNATYRVFHIAPGKVVTMSDLTVTNGNANEQPVLDGGGIYNDHATLTLASCTINNNSAFRDGGGVYNGGAMSPGTPLDAATLILNNCVVSDNSTGNDGGGLCNDGSFGGNASLQISNSGVTGNSAGFGAGMLNDARLKGTAMLHISDSTLSANSAGYGGAIFNIGDDLSSTPLTVTDCTISDNSAQVWGGGIYNHGMLTLANSTISGNVVNGGGGAIYNESSALSANSTLSGNSAISGGGIYNSNGGVPPSAFALSNTILNAGASGENIHNGGSVTSFGYNLSSDDAGGYLDGLGDQINTDPLLGPLQDNGGPTLTHALLPGSPAINAGDPNFNPPPYYDQRGPGFDRVRGGRIDVGSFEVQNPSPPSPTPTATPSATPTPTATSTPRVTPTPRIAPTPRPRPSPARRP